MTRAKYSFPPGSTVLVTGANSFLGSHVINILLELGYRVRGTVRSPRPWLNEYFSARYGSNSFETAIVADFQLPHAFDEAISGVSGVVHMAQAMPWDPSNSDPVGYTVAGTLHLLEAAAKEQSVKRVVLASSIVAAGYPQGDQPFRLVGYLNPGNCDIHIHRLQDRGRATGVEMGRGAQAFIRTQHDSALDESWYIDVEDSARLHVIALLSTEVQSERLFGAAAPFVWSDIIPILKKAQPANESIPGPPQSEKASLGEVVPARRAEQLIRTFFGRPGWTTLEESIKGTVKTA
uniref:Putative ketoreductase n=1 Tax=Emericella variicolor TaxID=1549217 RepID=A0A1L7NQ53_EMEVA|nr:putative ketoreductase [Aspergillus stellatus]